MAKAQYGNVKATKENPRYIQLTLYPSPSGAKVWQGYAVQVEGDVMWGKVILLKTLYGNIEEYVPGIKLGDEFIVSEWEWNGGIDLDGAEREEVEILYKEILEKENIAKVNIPGDFISRKAAIELFCELKIDNVAVNGKRITEYISEQPTVFSIENVMKELREASYDEPVSDMDPFGDVPHKVVSLRKANEIIQRGGIVDEQTKGNIYAEFDWKCRQAGLSEVFITKSKSTYEYMLKLLIYCDAKGYEDEANCNFEIRFK